MVRRPLIPLFWPSLGLDINRGRRRLPATVIFLKKFTLAHLPGVLLRAAPSLERPVTSLYGFTLTLASRAGHGCWFQQHCSFLAAIRMEVQCIDTYAFQ